MRTIPTRDFTLVDLARAVSVAAHCAVNQKRKYTGEDYFHHPEEVLQILLTYDDPTPEMQAVALLHDVVEDTAVPFEQIQRLLGKDVADLVYELTDQSKPEDGNRATRKAIDLKHLSAASSQAMRIKCADLISNSKSITNHDEDFAKVYLVEKLNMLKAMQYVIGEYDIWAAAYEVGVSGIFKLWPDYKDQYEILKITGLIDINFDEFEQRRERGI